MRTSWWIAGVVGTLVLGCSSAPPPRPAAATATPTAKPTPAPTATVAPSPSATPVTALVASPSPSPSPTASPTPAPNDPSLGLDGVTRPSYGFTVSKGQVFSVVLPGHATEGYKWALAPGFDTKVLSGTGQSRPGTKPANAGVGVSAPQVFDFTAVASGNTSLVFDLVMPSDPKKASVENRKFAVTVL